MMARSDAAYLIGEYVLMLVVGVVVATGRPARAARFLLWITDPARRLLLWLGGPLDRWSARRRAAGLREDATLIRAASRSEADARLADRLDASADRLDPAWRV